MGKQVTLVYTYGLKNGGDMAINIGAIDILLEMGVKINAVSRYASGDREYDKMLKYLNVNCPEVEVFECPFQLVRGVNKLENIRQHAYGFIKLVGIKNTNDFDSVIRKSDLVVFNGGNFLRFESLTDFVRLLALTYPLRKSLSYGVPYVIFPHSASNIGVLGKGLIHKYIKKAKKLWTREDISYDYLSKKFDRIPLSKSIDLAFFIRRKPVNIQAVEKLFENELHGNKCTKIAVTLRAQTVGDLREVSKEKYNKIITRIEKSLESYLINSGYQVILIVQSIKDHKITKEVYGKLSKNKNLFLVEEYDPLKLKEIFNRCDVLLGMRLHSIILSLSVGTPAIGYFDKSWGFKNPGLMEKFELPYKFIDDNIESLDKEIQEVLDNLETHKKHIRVIIDDEREKFKKELSEIL